jgi:hypothetical protein
MRITWSLPLPGPFRIGGTLWRSKRRPRGKTWHGTLPGWKCHHDHRTVEAARECAAREQRKRRP